SGILRRELTNLEVYHHVGTQFEMIEEYVDLELIAAHFQRVGAADKREPPAQLQQELADVADESFLKLALAGVLVQREKVKIERILEGLSRQVGLRRGEGTLEIGDGFALSLVEPCLDLMGQDAAAPTVFIGSAQIPLSGRGVRHL